MHWLVWAFIACIVFLITYNPRTGSLGKFFTNQELVEDNDQRTTQSDSNPSIPRE